MMSKSKIVTSGLLGLALLAAPWSNAEAQYCRTTTSGTYCYVGGAWIKYGSLVCSYSLSEVPATKTHPAKAQCTMDVSSVEILCQNPKNHAISPGSAAVQTQLVVAGAITMDDLSKIRGQTDVNLTVSQADLERTFGVPENCVNPNWIPVNLTADAGKYTAALVRAVAADSYNFSCATDTTPIEQCELCSTAHVTCTLPSEYSLATTKQGTQPYLPPKDAPYSCEVVSITEGLCGTN